MTESASASGVTSYPANGEASGGTTGGVDLIDHFVFMAGLFVAAALVGFETDSIGLIQAKLMGLS